MRTLVAGLITGAATIGGMQQVMAAKWATYHIHHVYLTPIKVQTTTSVGYSTADAGKMFLVVTFHVVNKDDVQEEVGYNDIKVITAAGKEVDQDFASPDNELSSTVLDPGGSADAADAWQVPLGSHFATLHWSPQPGFSDVKYPDYAWKVKF